MVARALNFLPTDSSLQHGWGESLRHVPHYKFWTTTNAKVWSVAVYAGGFYVARVGDRPPEPCTTISSLIGYLYTMLRLREEGSTDQS
jgi:hypothetical protein